MTVLHETGLVSEVIGDKAIVKTQNQLACSSCKVVDSCGNGIIEKYLSGKIFSSEIYNRLNAKVGDEVLLEIPKSSITKASMIVYLVPLLTFFSAGLLATVFFLNENMIILISLLGLFSGFFVTKFYNQNILKSELYMPSMVSIINSRSSLKECVVGCESNKTINIKEI